MSEAELEYVGVRIGLDGLESFLEGSHEDEVKDVTFRALFDEASESVSRLMAYLQEQGIYDYYA